MGDYAPIVATGISILAGLVAGLVAWAARAEISTMRAEMRTMQAEMRAGVAEAINGFWRDLNGSYIKRDLYNTLVSRVDGLENRVNDLGE